MKNNSIESNRDDLEINHRPQKTWKEALLLMSDLMQVQNYVKMNLQRRKDLFYLFSSMDEVPNVVSSYTRVSMTELRFSQLLNL